ncbi:MAG: DUF4363 family protein, partial [Ruminococcus sp.]
AIVGPSGSGKTTVAGLISRFFDPQEGRVLIGGKDVRQISKESLMRHVAYVFQDSRLLKRSIADNLRIAKPDATESEMMDALKKAQCMDIIDRLPEGINTVLGSRGTYLSGGEQQRIAIARTMLKNADVVILDEASAFADPECEAQVQLAFREMAKGRTVIMIAHRLSTIRNADRVYVLKDGQVEDQGKHDDLLKENKTKAALALCRETEYDWDREVGKIYALLSHDYADAIGGAISKMRAHLEHDDPGMYFAESTSAKKGLASIKGSEYPLFENIL